LFLFDRDLKKKEIVLYRVLHRSKLYWFNFCNYKYYFRVLFLNFFVLTSQIRWFLLLRLAYIK